MIVVRVELKSARTGLTTELARMEICNDETGTASRRNYITRTLRGRSARSLDEHVVQRQGKLRDWPSDAVHVWNLVAAALHNLRYGEPR